MIHHVQLACPAGSEPALREFYGGVLGFAELAKPPVLAARGGCWFRGHGIELHLGVEEDFRPARKAHPGLLVEGLDAWAARLREAGYPVAYDDDFPGMRRFYSQDPHGNRLEFLEPDPADRHDAALCRARPGTAEQHVTPGTSGTGFRDPYRRKPHPCHIAPVPQARRVTAVTAVYGWCLSRGRSPGRPGAEPVAASITSPATTCGPLAGGY